MSYAIRVFWSTALVALGFAVGQAQAPTPDFMLAIDAPVGETRVECVSGCKLLGARDLRNPNAGRMLVYSYSCGGQTVNRCEARVAGWLTKN